jgi:hypothetical protein
MYGAYFNSCVPPCRAPKLFLGAIVEKARNCMTLYWDNNYDGSHAYYLFAAGRQNGDRLILTDEAGCTRIFEGDGTYLRYIKTDQKGPCNVSDIGLDHFNEKILSHSIRVPQNIEGSKHDFEWWTQRINAVNNAICKKSK